MHAEGVTEFVILSGPDVHDYLLTVRAQLRAYLKAAFPACRFSLVSQPDADMGFVVVPVVGSVGDGVAGELLEPNPYLLAEIAHALEAFQPQVPSTLH